jgi:hypothetical protein
MLVLLVLPNASSYQGGLAPDHPTNRQICGVESHCVQPPSIQYAAALQAAEF